MKKHNIFFFILSFLSICLLTLSVRAQNSSAKPPCTLFIEEEFFFGNGSDPNLFLNVNVELINNTNDTVRYVGTSCNFSKFYIVDNPNMIMVDKACNDRNKNAYHFAIASHKAAWTQLTFKFRTMPDTTFDFKIGMKLIKWDGRPIPNISDAILNNAPVIYSAIEKFRTDKNHQMYGRTQEEDRVHELMKPIPDYHQLTKEDRRNFILNVSEVKIIKGQDFVRAKKIFGVVDAKLDVLNNSNDTLKYLSMTCSWWEIYQTNIEGIYVKGDDCNSNIPTIVSILPHSKRTDDLFLIYDKTLASNGARFKVGMCLQEYVKGSDMLMGFDIYDYLLRPETSNIIWSNEVAVP